MCCDVRAGDGGLLLLEEILYTGGSFLGEGLGIEHFNRVLRIFVRYVFACALAAVASKMRVLAGPTRLGQMVRAHEMLEDLQKHGIQPNIDSYNAIIYGTRLSLLLMHHFFGWLCLFLLT